MLVCAVLTLAFIVLPNSENGKVNHKCEKKEYYFAILYEYLNFFFMMTQMMYLKECSIYFLLIAIHQMIKYLIIVAINACMCGVDISIYCVTKISPDQPPTSNLHVSTYATLWLPPQCLHPFTRLASCYLQLFIHFINYT